jgi:hypothetical protein
MLEEAIFIGAAMVERSGHRCQHPMGRGSTAGKVHHPGYSTHGVNPR